MAVEKIERFFTPDALSQFEKLNVLVNTNVESFEKLVAEGVKLNNTLGKAGTFDAINKGAKDLSENEKDLIKQIANLTSANEKLNKLFEQQTKKIEDLSAKQKKTGDETKKTLTDTEKAQQRLSKAQSDEAKEVAKLNLQTQQLNATNKQNAKITDDNTSAYNRLAVEYDIAAKKAQDLAVEFGVESKQAKEAAAGAQELDKRLKAADASVGKFQRNVGNYSGALKTLEKALQQTQAKQDAYRKSGQANADVLAQLQKEENLLTQLLNSQVAGFATATAEIKANTLALQKMEAAGQKGTEAYNELFATTAALKDETADLKTALTNAAPDDVAFNAAADAAKGLIGVYGLAKSASAAFGIENEAFEETLVKLQAAETALQSIEAIRALFKKENAVQQAIGIGLQKIEVLQTNLQTAAESKNIVVRYAAIIAQKALNAVMSLAGGPLLAIIGLIALLVITLSSFSSAAVTAAKDFETLSNEFEGNQNKLKESVDDIKAASDINIAALKANFASEKQIRAERIKGLLEEKQRNTDFVNTYLKDYQRAIVEATALTNRQTAGEELSKKEEKALADALGFIDKYSKARIDKENSTTALTIQNFEDRRDATLEEIKLQQNAIDRLKNNISTEKALREQQSADETKSFDQRIQAQIDANRKSLQLIELEAQKQRKVPGLLPNDIKNIENEKSNALILERKNGQEKVLGLQKEFAERERAASFEIAKIPIQIQADASAKIAADQEKSLEDRLFAQFDFFNAQKVLIEGQRNFDLTSNKLTATERKAINDKSDAEILAARIAFNDAVNQITLENLQKSNDIRINEANKERDETLKALNDRFNAGKIGITKYNQERLKIETGYSNEILDTEIENLKKLIEAYKLQGKDISALEADLANKQLQLDDKVTNKKIENQLKLKENQKTIGEETFGLFQDLVLASYDREKNKIQEQIDAIDKKKENDILVANQTITNEQQKANAIAVINANAQAQKEALERKQRQLDVQKARFQKAVDIAKIITDTAKAVVEALPNIPLAVSVGVIGAIQLARAIATPIPAFAEGTQDSPGGNNLVGDAGKREWVVTPTGKLFKTPNIPTVMNIPKHSVIYPNDKAALEAGVFNDFNIPAVADDGWQYKYMTEKLGGKLDNITAAVKKQGRVKRIPIRTGWKTIVDHGGNQQDWLNGNLQ